MVNVRLFSEPTPASMASFMLDIFLVLGDFYSDPASTSMDTAG